MVPVGEAATSGKPAPVSFSPTAEQEQYLELLIEDARSRRFRMDSELAGLIPSPAPTARGGRPRKDRKRHGCRRGAHKSGEWEPPPTLRPATIRDWKRNPAFVSWLFDRLREETGFVWEFAVLRQTVAAAKGSVQHFQAVARVRENGLDVRAGIGLTNRGAAAAIAARGVKGPATFNLVLGVPLTPPPPAEGEEPFLGVPDNIVAAGLVTREEADRINAEEAARRRKT